MTLPNFMIIGAVKAGTTALHAYLRQHPQVFMPALKETNFFTTDGKPPDYRGPGDRTIVNRDVIWQLEDYKKLFQYADHPAVGEASPWYLCKPDAANRIYRLLPDVKLIAILRHPADRAFSHFSMRRRDGFEPCKTLLEAIKDEPRRIEQNWSSGMYFHMGLYGEQLQAYYDIFPSEQIKVFLYEDFVENGEEMLEDIYRFIGVNPDFRVNTNKPHNVSGTIANPVLRMLWTQTHSVRSIVRPVLPKMWRSRVAKFFTSQKMIRTQIPQTTRCQLVRQYRPDILKLQSLLDRDLTHWMA